MKILIKEDENIETIEVDQNSKIDDIYNQINRKYNYLLSFWSHILERGYLIDQYIIMYFIIIIVIYKEFDIGYIKHHDSINLLELGAYKIKIIFKPYGYITQIFYDAPINILI